MPAEVGQERVNDDRRPMGFADSIEAETAGHFVGRR